MRGSMVFGSLILLLLLATSTTTHGLRKLDMHVAPNKNKISGQQEEIQAYFKWQRRPSSSGSPVGSASVGRHGGMTPEDHASTARSAAAEKDGEVKKRRAHRVVPPTLIHEDYAGPNGHSPNHHRTIRCGPC